MKLHRTLAVLALGIVPYTVLAQSSTDVSNTSNSTSSTSSQSAALNQGVTAVVNQQSAGTVQYSGEFTQDVRSQVPLSVVGYGSFSQYSCVSSLGVGATTRIFSLVYNGPKADRHCQFSVSSDTFGRESQLALQQNQYEMAEILRASSVWAACMATDEIRDMCVQTGQIIRQEATDIYGKKTEGVYDYLPSPRVTRLPARPTATTAVPSDKR